MERSSALARVGAAAAAATVLAAGCASGPEPTADAETVLITSARDDVETTTSTAGPAAEETTLTLGNALMDMPEQLILWAVEVRARTDASITFEVVSQYGGAVDAWVDREQLLIDAVSSGEVDLAWVGARALPTFDPLLAPMLVDSHDLQAAVFAAGIPDRMLDDVGVEGVTGLGVLPGPHRRLLGVSQDFRAPEDFHDAVVMSEQNAPTLRMLEVLGAQESVPGREGNELEGLDGLVGQVGAVVGNHYQDKARSFTTNLNLWPRPLVLLASTETLESLSDEHRQALLGAAVATLSEQLKTAREEDALSEEGREQLCSSPLKLVDLTDDELAALRSSVEPVLEELRQDEVAAAYLEEIQALKVEVAAPPDVFTCDGG